MLCDNVDSKAYLSAPYATPDHERRLPAHFYGGAAASPARAANGRGRVTRQSRPTSWYHQLINIMIKLRTNTFIGSGITVPWETSFIAHRHCHRPTSSGTFSSRWRPPPRWSSLCVSRSLGVLAPSLQTSLLPFYSASRLRAWS